MKWIIFHSLAAHPFPKETALAPVFRLLYNLVKKKVSVQFLYVRRAGSCL